MADCKELDILIVTTTVGSLADAKRLAHALVDAKLAACVQLDEVAASVYRWGGRVCEDAEVRLTSKTVPHRGAALEAFFADPHPYDVPQFVAVPGRASAAYGDWVRAETA